MRRLQIALDLTDLEKAVEIALEVADYVDHIEAGTPLIKMYGMKSVERLKDEVGKTVVADMKIMDTGMLEAEIAYEAGADYTTVLGAAHIKTINDVLETGKRYGKGVMIDTIALENPDVLINKLARLEYRPDYILIHSGIDMQISGITPKDLINRFGEKLKDYKVGVAGGININNIREILGYRWIDLIIIGGGLTRVDKPRETAKKIRDMIIVD